MAEQMTFKRYEIKYAVTETQRQRLIDGMQEYMIRDSHGISQIQSLYFDTPDYLLARRSMEHPLYKEKIRLRSYGQADDHTKVFLELKKKFEGVVYKRRVSMDMTKAEELMENWSSNRYGVTEVDCNPQILRELEASVARYPKLIPRILLTYRREAFYQRDNHDFRVTLDQEIGWRNEDLSLRDPIMGRPLLKQSYYLMEVKAGGAIPLWFTKLLTELGIRKTSFSKYGTAYQTIFLEHNDPLGLSAQVRTWSHAALEPHIPAWNPGKEPSLDRRAWELPYKLPDIDEDHLLHA